MPASRLSVLGLLAMADFAPHAALLATDFASAAPPTSATHVFSHERRGWQIRIITILRGSGKIQAALPYPSAPSRPVFVSICLLSFDLFTIVCGGCEFGGAAGAIRRVWERWLSGLPGVFSTDILLLLKWTRPRFGRTS